MLALIKSPSNVKQRAKQKGVALITVMLIVALAAILAAQMTARLQMQMQRTTNIALNQQAYWYAIGAEAFAKRILITTFEDEDDVTHLEQMWAQGETSYPVDDGQITGEITDLHACFNLNALRFDVPATSGGSQTKPKLQTGFEELIVSLNVEGVSQFEAEYMTDALVDWLDSNTSISSAGGAEDNDYGSREFPFLPANSYLSSVNELRIIEHFTVDVINKLKDYVCVLPDTNLMAMNLNTVNAEQPELLASLLNIPKEDVEQALSSREGEGYKNVGDFFQSQEISKHKITQEIQDQFVIKSQYFKLKTTASFNNSFFSLQSVFKVEDKNNISVISRTIGRE